jgi:hypothetical protein
MKSMRERIARAICLQMQGKDFGSVDPNDDDLFVMSVDQIELLERACEAASDAVLAELETPTPGMIEDGSIGLLRAQGYDTEKLENYDDAPDKNVTKVEFEHAFHAAIRAAREGK